MIYATVNSSINRLTKCAKMQKEEQNKKDALNGNGECVGSNADREEIPRNAYTHGGRLKFFKDGKFILELERSREGERMSWVSVPRKTFWPPQGTAVSTPTYRQEGSTSLSVSDDNSSIQSSPWQRDHSWKQTSPSKNVSKELCFYFKRLKKVRLFRSRKRRRPYDTNLEILKELKVNLKSSIKKPPLLTIVQSLTDKFANSSPPRAEMVVSPRKRFLREMEKDSKVLVDDACLKRSRGKAPTSVSSPVRANGNAEEVKVIRNNSYSITSLLADDRDRIVKKEPASSPSHFSPGNVAQQQYCPVKTEDRWYSESVDRLRSIEINHPDKRLYTPYPPSYVPPFVYPYQIPPQFYPNLPRGFPGIPSVYPMHMPLHRDAPAPSCSWASEPSRDTEHRDENITDMPLNLSKHAG